MVGIGRAGSSFGGVSGKAKGSGGVVISEEVRAAVADVVANSSETVWYVCLCVSWFLFRATGHRSPMQHVISSARMRTEQHQHYAYRRRNVKRKERSISF